jgi:hypothetical protein
VLCSPRGRAGGQHDRAGHKSRGRAGGQVREQRRRPHFEGPYRDKGRPDKVKQRNDTVAMDA